MVPSALLHTMQLANDVKKYCKNDLLSLPQTVPRHKVNFGGWHGWAPAEAHTLWGARFSLLPSTYLPFLSV